MQYQRAFRPHGQVSPARNYRAERVSELRHSVLKLWVLKCTLGKHQAFFDEAKNKIHEIAAPGGHIYTNLLGDIDTVLGYKKTMTKEQKHEIFDVYERILSTLLSPETVEKYHDEQAARRALRKAQFLAERGVAV